MILKISLDKTNDCPYVPTAIYTNLYGNFDHGIPYYFLLYLPPLLE